jgi:glycosyltransferase involved in cell wall biosynthesis
LLEDGRRELAQIISAFPCLYADSEYNAQEMRDAGAQNSQVLPIAVDPALWEQAPCEQVLAHIGDGRRNILFVGRISPNKNQRELVLAFQQFRVLDPESRLILVGGYDPNDEYFRQLRQSVDMLGLADNALVQQTSGGSG